MKRIGIILIIHYKTAYFKTEAKALHMDASENATRGEIIHKLDFFYLSHIFVSFYHIFVSFYPSNCRKQKHLFSQPFSAHFISLDPSHLQHDFTFALLHLT